MCTNHKKATKAQKLEFQPRMSVLYRDISWNILHHLEIMRYYNNQKILRYFNDIFLCLILINFGLLWTWKQLQIIFLVVLLYMWASISKFLLLYLICYYICDELTTFMKLEIWHFCRIKTEIHYFWASGKNRPAPSALRPGGKSIFRPFSGKKGGKLWSSVFHRKRAENIPNSAL